MGEAGPMKVDKRNSYGRVLGVIQMFVEAVEDMERLEDARWRKTMLDAARDILAEIDTISLPSLRFARDRWADFVELWDAFDRKVTECQALNDDEQLNEVCDIEGNAAKNAMVAAMQASLDASPDRLGTKRSFGKN